MRSPPCARDRAVAYGPSTCGALGNRARRADRILREVREGTFHYTVTGSFGRDVEEAREQARWGDTDAAWHAPRATLPQWQPSGPDQLAPLGPERRPGPRSAVHPGARQGATDYTPGLPSRARLHCSRPTSTHRVWPG